METYFDSIEEEREYLARRERRKRMIMERKRRRRRKLIMRMIICFAAVFAVIFTVAGSIVKKVKADKEQKLQEEIAQQQIVTEPEVEEPEPVVEEPVVEKPVEVYEFQRTDNTKYIYNEEVISTYAVLINDSTDKIVAAKDEKTVISPASMTKVLTVLVAAEHITEEQLDDTFTMTIEITDYSYVNDCSNVGFLVGEQVKVRDLFYGTILPSGGDAAVGLATYVAGSHEAFVELMNEKLNELGLSETAHFTNCVGLYDADHHCTVYDMAVIMKAAMENELCREVLKTKCYTTEPTAEHPEGLTISNWFIRRIEDKETYGEIIGAKTGFVAQSGSCAVSYQMADDGTPYICVTAGSSSSWRCIYDHVEIYTRYTSPSEVTSGE